MQVLVTGIDGFVGSHLAEFLLGVEGAEVCGTVLEAVAGPNISGIAADVRLEKADIRDAERVLEVFQDVRPDRVIHLAAQAFVPASVQDPSSTVQVNVFGTVSVLEAARRMGEDGGAPPAVLIVSSGEAYGKVPPHRQPITEESPLQPQNPYAASKASAELIARAYRHTYGLNVLIARPFNHAGPRQGPSFVTSEFGRCFAEIASGRSPARLRVGNIEAERDFTDVRDVVKAYWALFDQRSAEEVFNVCSGHAYPIREVITLYEEITGIKVEIVRGDEKARPYDTLLIVGSNERLRLATGWSPAVAFRDTLRDVFLHWREQIAQGS
ncbi:MAG: GDP-mannose 4,6-dehydratase [Bacteroidota bacterium]